MRTRISSYCISKLFIWNTVNQRIHFCAKGCWAVIQTDKSNLNKITKKIDDLAAVCAATATDVTSETGVSVTTANSDLGPVKMCRVSVLYIEYI